MLLLNINRKTYMGNPVVCLHFTLMTLEGHSDFEGLNVINEPRLAMLLVNCDIKPYMGNPIV